LKNPADTPFESIEGAQEYLRLLGAAVHDTRQEVESDIGAPLAKKQERRLQALRIVAYKLEKLEQHMKSSQLILNDLRSLRRLLFEERRQAATATADEPTSSDVVCESELDW
jgi:uncharacterized membrane protein YccC